MTTVRIVVVALVDPAGRVLLRLYDEQSAVRANRWSLLGGGVEPGADTLTSAAGQVLEQSGLRLRAPKLVWRGFLPDMDIDTSFYAAATTARPQELKAQPGHQLEFVPGASVLSGRSFTPATGYVLGRFPTSLAFERLAGPVEVDGLA